MRETRSWVHPFLRTRTKTDSQFCRVSDISVLIILVYVRTLDIFCDIGAISRKKSQTLFMYTHNLLTAYMFPVYKSIICFQTIAFLFQNNGSSTEKKVSFSIQIPLRNFRSLEQKKSYSNTWRGSIGPPRLLSTQYIWLTWYLVLRN